MATRKQKWFMASSSAILIGLVAFYYLFPGPTFNFLIKAGRASSGLAHRHIVVEGLRFEYLEGGSGEALVLLHGFGANKDNWTRIGRYLTPHYRVIAPDLTGFGESSPAPDDDYTIRAQAARVNALVRALGIQSFHLGGSSMGGNIAGAYAAIYPQDVKSLLLIAPGGVVSADPSDMHRRLIKGDPFPLVAANTEGYERLLDFVFHQRPFIPHPVKKVLMREVIAHRPLHLRIFQQFRHARQIEPLETLLNGRTVPTLIVWGSQDRVLHVSGAKILAAVMPNAEAAVMNAVGHLPMIEKPRETAELVLNFFQRRKP